jgi:hypothetical protein
MCRYDDMKVVFVYCEVMNAEVLWLEDEFLYCRYWMDGTKEIV